MRTPGAQDPNPFHTRTQAAVTRSAAVGGRAGDDPAVPPVREAPSAVTLCGPVDSISLFGVWPSRRLSRARALRRMLRCVASRAHARGPELPVSGAPAAISRIAGPSSCSEPRRRPDRDGARAPRHRRASSASTAGDGLIEIPAQSLVVPARGDRAVPPPAPRHRPAQTSRSAHRRAGPPLQYPAHMPGFDRCAVAGENAAPWPVPHSSSGG